MKKKCLFYCLHLAIFILVIFFWARMTFGYDHDTGRLSAPGLGALKYFTIQSNLLCALGSLSWMLGLGRHDNVRAGFWALFRLAGVVSVLITFLVVIFFLGPMFGFAGMYAGSSLYLHLIVPLLALLTFFLTGAGADIPQKKTLWAALPLLLYGIGYVINLIVHWTEHGPGRHDFYGFATWGLPVGLMIFLLLLCVAAGLSFGLCRLSHALAHRKQT